MLELSGRRATEVNFSRGCYLHLAAVMDDSGTAPSKCSCCSTGQGMESGHTNTQALELRIWKPGHSRMAPSISCSRETLWLFDTAELVHFQLQQYFLTYFWQISKFELRYRQSLAKFTPGVEFWNKTHYWHPAVLYVPPWPTRFILTLNWMRYRTCKNVLNQKVPQ